MDNQQLAALIAAFITAHGAATLAAAWKGVQYAVGRLIEWERLIARVNALEENQEKIQKDLNEAFKKLRS